MKLFLTRISFPRTSASCVDYLSKEFAGLAPWQSVVVVVYPRGITFGAMEGTRLAVVNADNFDEGLRQVDVAFRELAVQASDTGRRYMAYAKVDRSYLDDLRSGAVQPDSSDGESICRLLQAAA